MVQFYSNAAGLSSTTDPVSLVFIVFLMAVIFLVLAVALWFICRRGRMKDAKEYIYSGKNRL